MESFKFQITNIKYQTNNPPQAEPKFKIPNSLILKKKNQNLFRSLDIEI